MSQGTAWDNFSVSTLEGERVMFSENQETEPDKLKSLEYTPPRSCSKYRRHLYTIGGSSIVIILIITIAVVCTKNNGVGSRATSSMISSSDQTIDFRGKVFLLINDTKLMKFDNNTGRLDLTLEAPKNSTIGAFVVQQDNDIHWTDSKTSRLISQTAKDAKILFEEKRFKPSGLDLDRISKNIYAVDKNAGILITMNLDNGYYAILLTDLVNAQDIVLDSEEGCMFILQHSHSIIRVNMDGTKPVEVVKNSGITALTVDSPRQRLYWINNYINIESSNYDGEKRQSVFVDSVKIIGITAIDGHLFWTWPSHKQSTSLLSCKLDSNDTCKEHATHEVNATGNAKSIRGYSTLQSSISNPCQVNNGGCKQLCLPSGRNHSVCACRMGWQLNPDHRSCHEMRAFVLYPYEDVVRTCSLDGTWEIFWPTPYKVKKMDTKMEIDFDYDLKNDDFYFTDDNHIHRMKLKSYDGQEIVLSTNSTDTIIEDIAYDWYTGNIYYGQRDVNASLTHSLVVFNSRLGEAYRKTVENYGAESYVFFKTRSYGVAVNPAEGCLFLSANHNNATTDVVSIKINDTSFSRTFIDLALDVRDHRFFAIDYATNRLYEIQSTVGDYTGIKCTSIIENSDTGIVCYSNITDARTIGVHQGWTYLSNFSSIWRFDTMTGKNAVKIAPRIQETSKQIVGVRIISEEVQFTGLDNPCAKNNGGCEQFCFAGSKATCSCKDGQKVEDNGRCD